MHIGSNLQFLFNRIKNVYILEILNAPKAIKPQTRDNFSCHAPVDATSNHQILRNMIYSSMTALWLHIMVVCWMTPFGSPRLLFSRNTLTKRAASGMTYGYRGCSAHDDPYSPDQWPLHWPMCGGSPISGHVQSPVNIRTSTVNYGYNFVTSYPSRQDVNGVFYNDGHTVTFRVTDPKPPVLRGVPLNFSRARGDDDDQRNTVTSGDFRFANLHFHIAQSPVTCSDCSNCADHVTSRGGYSGGSEHTINGEYFHGEIHMVHWNTIYPNIDVAASSPDGLSATGVFFRLSNRDTNAEIERILEEYVRNLELPGTSVPAIVDPSKVIPFRGPAYSYAGTKTTPKCNQNVQFVLFRDVINVSVKGYSYLQRLLTLERAPDGSDTSVPLKTFGNRRPVQTGESPNVFANFVDDDDDDLAMN